MNRQFKEFLLIYTGVAMVIFGIIGGVMIIDSFVDKEKVEKYEICKQIHDEKGCYNNLYNFGHELIDKTL